MLCDVHRTPDVVRGGVLPDPLAYVVRGGRIERSRRLVQQQQRRLVQQRLCELDARLLARRQRAAFHAPEPRQVERLEQCLNPALQLSDAVEQSEDAEVLFDGQIAGQWRVDSGEVRAREGPLPLGSDVVPLNRDRPEVGASTPRIMLMVVVFPAPFGPTMPRIS